MYRGGNSQWIEIIDGEKSKKGIIYNRILNSSVRFAILIELRMKL